MEDVDLQELPAEFHDLIPLIDEWAIGDDLERESNTQAASTDELKRLTEAVQPRLDAINTYLDENDHLHEATFLGRLAVAAVEAGFELDERDGT